MANFAKLEIEFINVAELFSSIEFDTQTLNVYEIAQQVRSSPYEFSIGTSSTESANNYYNALDPDQSS